ncbi:1-phosphofructokinase [Bacillus massiliglaciei]|uniref:1-phosphofructokinase n=1 Tax=Bacillus massiliglaciei TaxID=1816693 RepID=UPI000A4C90AB|nr:1-phosphofructokinase [Bacillus massiliglaciei]
MIYTVTLNPSIDYVVMVDSLKINELNRSTREATFPGGKGINVSRVLIRLGQPSTALGFLGGFTGRYLKECLENEQIYTSFIEVEENTRINIKLKSESETEINAGGPKISEAAFQSLKEQIERIEPGDALILSGSIPATLPDHVYETFTAACGKRGIKVAVDCSGEALLKTVPFKPFLIKPNHHELGELFGIKITNISEAAHYGRKLAEMGAEHVIVSMAGDGAVLCTKDAVYTGTVPAGKVMNSVGAGDSMVAGFIGSFLEYGNLVQAFRNGIAAGSATAFSEDLGTKEKMEALLPEIKVIKLEGGV